MNKTELNNIEIYSRFHIVSKKMLIPFSCIFIILSLFYRNYKILYILFLWLIIFLCIVMEVNNRKLSNNIKVEYVGDKVVAFIDYTDKCHIGGLFVLPSYQNKGIGKKLLRHVRDNCKTFTYTTSPMLGSDNILLNNKKIRCNKDSLFRSRTCTFL